MTDNMWAVILFMPHPLTYKAQLLNSFIANKLFELSYQNSRD